MLKKILSFFGLQVKKAESDAHEITVHVTGAVITDVDELSARIIAALRAEATKAKAALSRAPKVKRTTKRSGK